MKRQTPVRPRSIREPFRRLPRRIGQDRQPGKPKAPNDASREAWVSRRTWKTSMGKMGLGARTRPLGSQPVPRGVASGPYDFHKQSGQGSQERPS